MNTESIQQSEAYRKLLKDYEAEKLRADGLDVLRKRHGIELAGDPGCLDEVHACQSIASYWNSEECSSAKKVLRQYCSTHQGLNYEWALHIVRAANDKAEKATRQLADTRTFEGWFDQVLTIAKLLGFKGDALQSIDRQAWREYFDEGLTPAAAWVEENESMN